MQWPGRRLACPVRLLGGSKEFQTKGTETEKARNAKVVNC